MIGRREILRALISTPIGAWLRPSAGAVLEAIPGLDASSHYRRAFAWLSNLTESDKELIRGWKIAPPGRAAKNLLRRAEPALSALHRGSSMPQCEWDAVVTLDAIGRGHLDVSNLEIGKIALLRARALAEAGRGREAIEDIFAVAGFGRHIGGSGVLIARVYQLARENEAIACLGMILLRLGRSTLEAIPGRIAALPPASTWSHLMRQEARFIASAVAEKIEAAEAPIGLETLAETGLKPAVAEDVLGKTGGDRHRMLDLAEGVVPCLAELAEVLEGPRDLFGPALSAFRSRPGGINPYAGSVVEKAETMRYATDRTEVFWTMVLAASARIVDGPDRFESIVDPYGDGPFSYQLLEEGFELRSALHLEGGLPAVLQVGPGLARTVTAGRGP